MKPPPAKSNVHDTRESWLLEATHKHLATYFHSLNHVLPGDVPFAIPENIRLAIGFPSTGRKGKRRGEVWHSSSSEDAHYEIFIRADLADPVEVLGVLVKELIHTALPHDTGHGKLFKAAASKVGLQGRMRAAMPGTLLQERLIEIAALLGPLPHAPLHIEENPLVAVAPVAAKALDRPRKQRTRRLNAQCLAEGCGFLVNVTAKQVRDVGPPHCPKHGAMHVEFPPDDDAEGPADTTESVRTPVAEEK
jgi:hypothetical protein